jgi:hypothetical protein
LLLSPRKQPERGALVIVNASDVPEFPIDLLERHAAVQLIDHTLTPKLAQCLTPGKGSCARQRHESRKSTARMARLTARCTYVEGRTDRDSNNRETIRGTR